ncbi:hypothetical protein [Actinoplanes aureus]|jgi:hypothetical protein|uniref:Uncharacterized protein n=1 Tax=Actinoplanes aureus TaxID=2792083 RepID=A0A931CAX5_9ACTN|nr:hypothetical protein [Actinoplanes aureus]MBG0564602.1 hypothetical protein [Actinoplanes aureus]
MGTRQAWTGDGRISGVADALAALQRVNATAQHRDTTAALAHAVQTADDAELAPDVSQILPADPSLLPLLPWPGGLRKGATVAAVGSTSLLMLLLAGAMRDTAGWACVVGMPSFGVLAAGQDFGVPVDRLALVPEPGPDWPTIVGTLLDGVDLVVVAPPADVPEGLARSLSSRARQRGAVLVPTRAWPGAELTMEVTSRRWHGLGQGRGRLRYCDLQVRSAGRGKAVRPRSATLSVPPSLDASLRAQYSAPLPAR